MFSSLSLSDADLSSEINSAFSEDVAEVEPGPSLASSISFGSIAVDVSWSDLRSRGEKAFDDSLSQTPSTAISFGSISLDDLHLDTKAPQTEFDDTCERVRFGSVSLDDLALLGSHHRYHRIHRASL